MGLFVIILLDFKLSVKAASFFKEIIFYSWFKLIGLEKHSIAIYLV
jgi:hypothetical protein